MTTFHNLPHKKADRRALRNNSTPAEAKLWSCLKCAQLAGRKFRRQQSFGEYVVDFYCPEEKLVIEVDGAAHFSAPGNLHDAHRTAFLNTLGLRVLRFENKLIWSGLETGLQEIESHFYKLPS